MSEATSPPVFPIGFWNGMPIARQDATAVRDWADAGMTLAMGPEFGAGPSSSAAAATATAEEAGRMAAILDAAQARGIRVILCHAHSHWRHLAAVGESAYRRDLAAAIGQFGTHPAVFGFHVGDEPGKAQFADACCATRLHRELAPHLTPFLNLLPWYPSVEGIVGHATHPQYLDAYVAAAAPALLCYDCYVQMNPQDEEWDSYADCYFSNLREFAAAAQRARVPFWTTLLSVGHFNYRCPREDDLRWQLNTAVAHGAQGILWFYFYMGRPPYVNYRVSPIDEHWERTETFAWLSRVNRTFVQRFGPIVARLALRRVSHYRRAWGGVPLFDGREGLVCAASSAKSSWQAETPADAPLIISEFADVAGRDYVMLVNNSQTKNTFASFTLRRRHARIARIAWAGQEEACPCCGVLVSDSERGTTVAQWLAPGQMELFALA